MSSQSLNKMAECRLKAATIWPYSAPALFAMSFVEKPGCGGIVADKFWRLYFDPAVISTMPNEQIVGKILLEMSHLLRAHAKRFTSQVGVPSKNDPEFEQKRKIWGKSAKLELVDDFDEERLSLPPGIERHEDLNLPTKLLAEHYYARLMNDQQQQSSGGSQQPNQKRQKSQSGGSKPQNQQGQQSGHPGQDEDEQTPPDGSAVDGVPRDWEQPAPSEGSGQDEAPGLSEIDAEIVRREVAKNAKEHSKSRGNVPSGMKRWAESVLEPPLDYRRIIANRVTKSVTLIRGNRDFSYRRPSRRTPPGCGFILPSMIDHQVNVAVVIDTSGSMSTRQLGEATKIVAGILRSLPRRDAIRVLSADADVHAVQSVFKEEQIELLGGGGTSMARAIEVASNLKPRPDIVIVVTDGETDWPDRPINDVPCLAIIVTDGTSSAPKWIDQVCVPASALDEEATAA